MPISKPKTTKKINQEGIIYALIFVLYIIALGIIFTYAIQFVRGSINTALGTPVDPEIENKYGQLDLTNYALVSNKLGLQKSSPVVIIPLVETSTPIIVSSTPVQIATTSLPTTTPVVIASSTPIIATPVVPTEKRPTTIVTNSTTKSGLAADLKNKLIAAGYQVLSTGNSSPSLAITTIKVKNSISPDSKYLAEIKKIVSATYGLVILPLADNAASDIEIIIGNK